MSKRKNKNIINNKYGKIVNNNKFWLNIIIFILISIILGSTFFIKDKIENFINFSYNENALSTIIDKNGLRIHFINVGQADATLIEFPNNEIMLIDCAGTTNESSSKFISYLNKIDFKEEDNEKIIDYLILTHPDSDHIGNAEYIFDNFRVKYCYRPDIYSLNEEVFNTLLEVQSTNELYANVIQKMDKENCLADPIKTCQELLIIPDTYNYETGVTDPLNWIVNFYAPIANKLPYRENNDYQKPMTNDYSPIFILTYLDKQIMFTGDASEDVEKAFLEFYNNETYADLDFDIDILKLGHHGSRYSTTEELLNFVNPEYAFVSAGQNNNYGHPSTYTLERLANYGLNNYDVYRTDLNGNTIIGVSVNGELTLTADYVQYTTFKLAWWAIFLIAEFILIIIIISPNLKYLFKKLKNSNKIKLIKIK